MVYFTFYWFVIKELRRGTTNHRVISYGEASERRLADSSRRALSDQRKAGQVRLGLAYPRQSRIEVFGGAGGSERRLWIEA